MSDEPRWLDEAELSAWMQLSAVLILLPAELDARMQRQADLNQFEYVVMARLSEHPGHAMRMSDLAGAARGSLSRLSHLMKRLEQRGWVRREPCPEDGRYTLAILTEAGYAKLVATAPIQVEAVRDLVVDRLTRAQLRQLGAISGRVLRGLADGPRECHGTVADC